MKKYSLHFVTVIFIVAGIASCKKAETLRTPTPGLPTIITTAITTITVTTAESGGNITADGGAAVTSRGVCWSTASNPTIDNRKTADGAGTGVFSSSISGLIAGTIYYVRAFATNSAGTAYGNELSFTTAPPIFNLPTLTTTPVTSITNTTVQSGGNITADGSASVTTRGVCWSTAANPTTANNKTADGSGTGVFSSYVIGLTAGVTYYVRAYATNSAGTAYGNELSFITTTTSKDVYVAGLENNGTKYVAKVWKNGVASSLGNGAGVYSIYVSGSDVYVAGYEPDGTNIVAIFWKNGVAATLTNGTNNAIANSIFVY